MSTKSSNSLKRHNLAQLWTNLLQGQNQIPVHALIFLIGFIFFGSLSVWFGQDNNWDLRNYHFYNPYAFVHGLVGFHYAPAQLQTFLNPMQDLPFYFLVTHLKPIWIGFIMGGIHGLSFGLIFTIAYSLFSSMASKVRLGLSLLCAAIGVYGPVFICELGATENDTLISLFVLTSVLLLIRRLAVHDTLALPKGRVTLILAGVIFGFAVGLKLTIMIYAIGTAIALILTERKWGNRFTILSVWGLAFVVSVLLSGGYWMAKMWSLYGNPLFPFYNNIFQSPFYELAELSDKRYLPQSIMQSLVYPFHFLTRTHFTYLSLDFRDSRYAVIYVLTVLYLLSVWSKRIFAPKQRKKGREKSEQSRKKKIRFCASEKFILIFFLISYIVWQFKFSVIRYTVPLEALGPIVIVILVRRIFQKVTMQSLVLGVAFLGVIVIVKPVYHERLPWSSTFFTVEVPEFEDPDHTIVVIAGKRPWSYLIPAFQPGVRFVRVESNFTGPNRPTRLQVEMRTLLQNHQGSIYLLSRRGYLRKDAETLKSYQMLPKSIECQPIKSKHERDGLCLWPVVRSSR